MRLLRLLSLLPLLQLLHHRGGRGAGTLFGGKDGGCTGTRSAQVARSPEGVWPARSLLEGLLSCLAPLVHACARAGSCVWLVACPGLKGLQTHSQRGGGCTGTWNAQVAFMRPEGVQLASLKL
uniref:Secreted protein n=1 Tax=Alexandrium monilatum TaxID=311494 RepID=A0A7S4QJ32_9DINO